MIKEEILNYIKTCHSNINKTDYLERRGITRQEIINYFQIGFDVNNKNKPVVIPYNREGSYFFQRGTKDSQNFKYRHKGGITEHEPLFNEDVIKFCDYVFINEAIFDSLSIMQVLLENGGTFKDGYVEINNLKISTISINGASSHNTLIRYLEENKDKLQNIIFLIALDFDEIKENEEEGVGQKQARILLEKIEKLELKVIFTIWSDLIIGKCKDINELLVNNKKLLYEEIWQNINYLSQLEREEREKYITDIYIKNDYLKAIETPEREPYKSKSFLMLNKSLGGGFFKGLYILGAITSLGKTTFCLNLTEDFTSLGFDVLYFSLEMYKRDLVDKIISKKTYKICREKGSAFEKFAKTSIGVKYYQRKTLIEEEEYNIIKQARDEFFKQNAPRLAIIERDRNLDIGKIREIIKKHIEITKKIPIVIIDYLQIMDFQKGGTDKQNIDNMILELKNIVKDFDLTIIAISSQNRASYNQEINLSSFKESGAIEYSADVLLGMQYMGIKGSDDNKTRDETKNRDINETQKRNDIRDVEIVILKNRFGACMKKACFKYNAKYNNFEEA